MTNGFQRAPQELAPTPLPRAEDLHSDQSMSAEERLQRLSIGRDRKAKNQKAYGDNHNNESVDDAASPLFNRLDSQNSYRNQKQAQSKIKQNSLINAQASNTQLVSPQSKRNLGVYNVKHVNLTDNSPYHMRIDTSAKHGFQKGTISPYHQQEMMSATITAVHKNKDATSMDSTLTRPQTQSSSKGFLNQIQLTKQSMKNIQNQQMTARKSPTNLHSKTKFSKHRNSKVSAPGKANYKCARCGMVIFGQQDLVDHHDIVFMSSASLNSTQHPAAYVAGASVVNAMSQSFMGQKSALAKCACLFLKVTDWMQRAGVKQYHSGFIECPNEQCQIKLGQYSVNGLKCNCGQSITPAYQIFKSKIRLSDHPGILNATRTVPQDQRSNVRSNFEQQNSRTINSYNNSAQ